MGTKESLLGLTAQVLAGVYDDEEVLRNKVMQVFRGRRFRVPDQVRVALVDAVRDEVVDPGTVDVAAFGDPGPDESLHFGHDDAAAEDAEDDDGDPGEQTADPAAPEACPDPQQHGLCARRGVPCPDCGKDDWVKAEA